MYNFNTFDDFIRSTFLQTIGAGECWDYINLIWNHEGSRYWTYPPTDPSATNHGVKWGVLNNDAKQANILDNIIFITSKQDLRKGDVVVTSGGEFGHAGFMQEDYTTDKAYNIYSQNYNNRRSVGLDTYRLDDFVGGFRYLPWVTPTPTERKKSRFKWVLYARRFREGRR